MNNNRNNNNRRRGRGNRPQGGGGGNPVNRIDSRARGNAPQMLEKYRKLAQDAQHNGDRVQAEYYLQFADHYYRVMADTRQRQEEQRPRRDDYREQRPQAADEFDQNEDGEGREDASEDRFAPRASDYERRSERPERQERPERTDRQDRPRYDDRRSNRDRFEQDRDPQPTVDADTTPTLQEADAAESEAPRRSRSRNGSGEPRRGRDQAVNGRGERAGRLNGQGAAADGDAAGIDAAVLPPAFNPVEQMEGEPVPVAPRRRRTKPVVQEGDAPIIVNG